MKRVKVFVHRDKESNYLLAEHLGLDNKATDMIRSLGYEIELVYDINEQTGEHKLVGADGFFLGDEPVSSGDVEVVEP